MMKAGVPLLQSFDIVGKGHSNPAVGKLLLDVKTDVETGSSLNQAFRKYPLYFDPLFCNLVAAGEQAGILETLLDRLAMYQEKTIALKGKIKKALFYPVMIILVAVLVTSVIMIFVIPSFKTVFTSFGADLPAPTLIVIAMSDFFVKYWYIVFGILFGGIYFLVQAWRSIAEGAGNDRPAAAEDTGARRDAAEGFDRALEPDARNNVRCGRSAGRGARLRRPGGRERGLQGSDEAGTDRSQHRHQPCAVDAEHGRGVSQYGRADDPDRRGIGLARFDAL
jgi:hypothetical protein